MGLRLGRSARYIRYVVKSLREKLSGCGVASLVCEEDDATHDDFGWELAPLGRCALIGYIGRL
jgi:hypothetical protein